MPNYVLPISLINFSQVDYYRICVLPLLKKFLPDNELELKVLASVPGVCGVIKPCSVEEYCIVTGNNVEYKIKFIELHD